METMMRASTLGEAEDIKAEMKADRNYEDIHEIVAMSLADTYLNAGFADDGEANVAAEAALFALRVYGFDVVRHDDD